jgi:hypothetical protein
VRRPAVILLALFAIGCGARDPGFRVDLPRGWDDKTPEYGSEFERGMNEQAPRWAWIDADGVWQDDTSGTTIAVGRLIVPPPLSLEALAKRMIRLSNEAVINFELKREPTAVRVDGAPAVIYDYTGSPPFGAVQVRIALIRHGGDVHLASLTATPHGFTAGSSRLAEILDSWRWI